MSSEKTALGQAFAVVAPRIGDTDNAGNIYAGLSRDRKSLYYGRELWVAPRDAVEGALRSDDVKTVVEQQAQRGQSVPTLRELEQIREELALRGLGDFQQERYWAMRDPDSKTYQDFKTGAKYYGGSNDAARLRLVTVKNPSGM